MVMIFSISSKHQTSPVKSHFRYLPSTTRVDCYCFIFCGSCTCTYYGAHHNNSLPQNVSHKIKIVYCATSFARWFVLILFVYLYGEHELFHIRNLVSSCCYPPCICLVLLFVCYIICWTWKDLFNQSIIESIFSCLQHNLY